MNLIRFMNKLDAHGQPSEALSTTSQNMGKANQTKPFRKKPKNTALDPMNPEPMNREPLNP